jgi:hypothetical protein
MKAQNGWATISFSRGYMQEYHAVCFFVVDNIRHCELLVYQAGPSVPELGCLEPDTATDKLDVDYMGPSTDENQQN